MKYKIREQKYKMYPVDKEWKKRFALIPTIVTEELSPEWNNKFIIWFEWFYMYDNEKYLKQ